MARTADQDAALNRWLRTLRSGKYKQGRNALKTTRMDFGPDNLQTGVRVDEFCCLGVACDLYNPEGWNYGTYLGTSLRLPARVRRSLGARNADPSMKKDDRVQKWFTRRGGRIEVPVHRYVRNNRKVTLAGLNDSGMTFKQIASFVEAFKDELFPGTEKAA